jgi:hypothetical protein
VPSYHTGAGVSFQVLILGGILKGQVKTWSMIGRFGKKFEIFASFVFYRIASRLIK